MSIKCCLRSGFALLFIGILSLPASAGTWQHEHGTLTLDEPPKRIITLNWAATEAVLLLGEIPVGVADRAGYDVWVNEPELPEGVRNIGTRVAPSLEAIAELEPDLIVTSAEMAPAADLLEQIAPTYVISVYRNGSRPFEKASEMLTTLGEMLGREDRANAILADIEQTLDTQRQRLEKAGMTDRPVALVNFLDDRHVRIYAPNSLYQSTLNALGLKNAWPREGNFWGFSVVGLEAIAPQQNSRLVVVSPTLPGLSDTLASSPFWTYLPAVRRDEIYQIDPVWPFGGVFPVKRLATMLTDSLLEGGSDNVR
ncbi:ABC transporter substrate-binding protein [Marinobacter vulgaris]|uniref:ABC transporter substrate-binding protein n=1 Tax=Marinobacter vulgaris TaxID=1928331 RepID=A0A2V3ZXB5_9GAMM|nr:iron-siderophore ABC transporter substrate-binding protein [Marinobacter vulgaris]PXX90312.1 ABC transporter substrate-binding protein [Marinobacter vulgaris]TSJ69663.1 iron-siderophore ABC transporter substrate-binding protein [Marinobacter vulgaris]